MAGIGFELRRHLRRGTLSSLARGYGYAGMISSGPWIVSILGVLFTGILSLRIGVPALEVKQFSVSVTYLMASSLILTSLIQLLFTRFVADRLFERRRDLVAPNLLGALALTTLTAGTLAAFAVTTLFEESVAYRVLMVASFVALCDLWIAVVLMAGLKNYQAVLVVLFCGYTGSVGLALALHPFGLEGLLAGFLVAHGLMLFSLLRLVIRDYGSDRLVSFDFLRPSQCFYSLALTGLFNTIGIWADKLLFWFNPLTSDPVIGPLRASLIYDLPIFLAYLSIVPGMGVFLVRMETDFAESYENFYDAVREGASLAQIFYLKDSMTFSLRQGVYEIFKVQGLTVLALLLAGERLLGFIGISAIYLPLFYIDLVAVGVQVVLLGVLNALFYLDQRRIALLLNLLFAASNITLTMITQTLGARFYGYGFAGSISITTFVGLVLLSRKVDRLEYETFMLRR